LGVRIIDHTADIGIEVWAGSLEALFSEAGVGMFDQICPAIQDPEAATPTETRDIEARGTDLDDLLVRFLSDLHFIFDTEGILFRSFEFEELDAEKAFLRAKASGLSLTEEHQPEIDIKAITYHNLGIEKTHSEWRTAIIFDI